MSIKQSTFSVLFLLLLVCCCARLSFAGEVCASHQFECSNGQCIPNSWSCDGENDCGDSSDEKEHCRGPVHCAESEFQCAVNGRCIPQRWQCDGENDCDDRSDEDPKRCQVKNCTEEQFSCKNRTGECIPLSWICDSNADCSDGTDEEGCSATCTADEFTCANGRCIQKRWFCDGENDCGDESDEGDHCPRATCPPDTNFNCGDSCVPNKWRCDGDVDCTNGLDEMDCPSSTPNVTNHCTDQEFQCTDGINCIHLSWQCDGDRDCPDGSDESSNCLPSTCRPDQFRCDDGECIPGHLLCSGQAECNDTSDEASCNRTATATGCKADIEFDCGGGLCIDMNRVCDGANDCGQWEDEPKGLCNVNECAVNNGNCSHTCTDSKAGHRCGCRPGYKLLGNSICIDVDECLQPGICSQRCINEKGTFKCECLEGYTRDPHDSTRCRATDGRAALLFTHRTDIRRFSLDRHETLTAVVNDTRSSTALDYHFESGIIYWSDVNDERIYRAPIDEGHVRSVVLQGDVVNADGLAVDWIYQHLYWTDSTKNTIEMAQLEGGQLRKTIVTDRLQEPRSIAVDPLEGWVYFSDWGSAPRIERAGMDGSHRQILVDSHVKWPNGITLDRADRRLFWVDAKMDIIASCDYDGSNRRVVLLAGPAIGHPFAVSVFEDWIYWSDWDHHTIMRANKFDGRNASSVTQTHSLQNPMVVHVYHPYRQPAGPNYCQPLNGRCSHFCLPAPQINERSPKFSCACPDGYTLLSDGLSCIPEDTVNQMQSASHQPALIVGKNETGFTNSGERQGTDPNTITGLIVGSVVAVLILASLVGYLIYRRAVLRNATSMNFDNPVYRKTTEDKFALAKNAPAVSNVRSSYVTPTTPEETLEPLTHPGTNEYV